MEDHWGSGPAYAAGHIGPVMTQTIDPETPILDQPALAIDGDAATYLEELLSGEFQVAGPRAETPDALIEVELVGPHLRVAGSISLGRFRRLSDVLNHHEGLLLLHDATILRRNGTATRVTTPGIWVRRWLGSLWRNQAIEVTLVGQPNPDQLGGTPPEFRIVKEQRELIVVTPGHTLTGQVYIPQGAELAVFIESADPAYIPVTDVATRSLADRRIITRYPFALLNRRHIVAATELQAGMPSACAASTRRPFSVALRIVIRRQCARG